MGYDVEYDELEDGSKPAGDFMLARDYKTQAKIFSGLACLAAMGPQLRGPIPSPRYRADYRRRAVTEEE